MSQLLEESQRQYIQEQQQELTFEEICPKYSTQIAMWDNLTPYAKARFISIIHCKSNRCIVGEAHGNSSNYIKDCDDCCRFANFNNGFPTAFASGGTPNWEKFEKIKAEFVGHFNRVHR